MESLSYQFGGCIQASVTLHPMGKIRLQEDKHAEALARVQETVTIFRATGSRHLPEAEKTLHTIQEHLV